MSDYVHALKFKFLTPFYDSLIAATMREGKFRKKFVDSLDLKPGQRVLDIGCGTGSLLKLIKQTYPDVEAIGIDGDSEILEIAKKRQRMQILIFNSKLQCRISFPLKTRALMWLFQVWFFTI